MIAGHQMHPTVQSLGSVLSSDKKHAAQKCSEHTSYYENVHNFWKRASVRLKSTTLDVH